MDNVSKKLKEKGIRFEEIEKKFSDCTISSSFKSSIGTYQILKEFDEEGRYNGVSIEGNTSIDLNFEVGVSRLKQLTGADCSSVQVFDKENLLCTLYRDDSEGRVGMELRPFLIETKSDVLTSFLKLGLTVRLTMGSTDDFVHILEYFISSREEMTVKEKAEVYLSYSMPGQENLAKQMLRDILLEDHELWQSANQYSKKNVENKKNVKKTLVKPVISSKKVVAKFSEGKENLSKSLVVPQTPTQNRTPFSVISSK